MTTDPTPEQRKSESVLESVVWFASSNFFRQLLGVVTAFLRPKLLTPELFGLYSLFRVIAMGAQYLHLGARSAMRYLGPQYRSRGDEERFSRLSGTAFVTSVGLNAVAAIGMISTAQVWPDLREEAQIGLYIAAALIVITSIFDHFNSSLKAAQRFKSVGQYNFLFAAVLLLTSVALMLWLGFYGALLAQVVTVAVMIGVFATKGLLKIKPSFDVSVLHTAMSVGGPTMLFDAFLIAIRSVDRIVIADMLGLEQLGFYALSSMIVGYVLNIPGATREVMEGKLFEQLDTMDRATIAKSQVHLPVMRMAFIMTPFIGGAVIAIPFVIMLILPEYAPGIPAVQVLTAGSWFLAVSYPLRGALVAGKQQKGAIAVLALALATHTVLTIVLINAGWGITGAAVSASAAFVLILAGHYTLALRWAGVTTADTVRTVALVIGLYALMSATLLGVFAATPVLPQNPWALVTSQGVLFGLVVLALIPLALRYDLIPPALIKKISARLSRGRGSNP